MSRDFWMKLDVNKNYQMVFLIFLEYKLVRNNLCWDCVLSLLFWNRSHCSILKIGVGVMNFSRI